MRLKLNNDNYIVGYGCFGNPDYPEYEWSDAPEELTGDYNLPLYKWDGTKPVYSPQPYTPEQLEEMRAEWIRTKIEKLYPQDLQLKINTEAMDSILSGQGGTTEFAQMNADRQKIKEESKTKDFQIQYTELK